MSLVMDNCVAVDSTVEPVGSELARDPDISPVPVVQYAAKKPSRARSVSHLTV